MKKLLIPIFILIAHVVHAQSNNSWIDYSKVYYKFKIINDGIYHIGQPLLNSAGLSNVPAEQFQLWHNGKEVRLYTSRATGVMAVSDYIEFWAKHNDGTVDKPLYNNPRSQLSDSVSLFTDTATYFLTVNPAGTSLRYASGVNDIADNVLPADNYFMRTIGFFYAAGYNFGYALPAGTGGESLYSGAYDPGEGWSSMLYYACCPFIQPITGMNVYTAGPANSVSCSYTAQGICFDTMFIQLKLNNTVVGGQHMRSYDTLIRTVSNLPLSYLTDPNTASMSLAIANAADPSSDAFVGGSMSITYPATFNFNGSSNFLFELQPSASGNYLVINNFNYGSSAPALYDEHNGIRYLGDISIPGQVRFALPASIDTIRKFKLVNETNSNIHQVASLTSKTFVDFSNTANQGNYLIISDPALYNDGNNINYVDSYRVYRASLAGGSYNAKVIDINELNDQFAFGVKKHPSAIRDFITYAQSWSVKPQYVFIIGRGMTWYDYRRYDGGSSDSGEIATANKLDLVQTFGYPASDILLTATPGTTIPMVPVGRLPAINGTEVGDYLEKMKDYELVQTSTDNSIENKAWRKNMMHITGGGDSSEDALFYNYVFSYQLIAQDTLFGANVSTFRKNSSNYVIQANSAIITQLINSGVSLITYFGHAAANTLAYNLDDPNSFQNQHRCFFFDVMGCDAGDFYTYDTTRLAGNKTISENFVMAKDKGSIGFLADTYLGVANVLNNYTQELYNQICKKQYGNSIGNQMTKLLSKLDASPGRNLPSFSPFLRMAMEEISLDGDPALGINSSPLPDYAVEDEDIKISPSIISAADNSFTVAINWFNLGRATDDSIRVRIGRKLPNGTTQVLYNQKILATKYMDTVNLVVHINGATDIGTNLITVTLDADQQVTELSELNDSVSKTFQIFQDELKPVYPYNYSIINAPGFTYTASTANALSGQRQYLMQIDTTALFNSPSMQQFTASGVGGIVQFTPNAFNYKDSTVYYWRTAMVPVGSEPEIWNSYSFIYLTTGGTGFNQSQYYQHTQSSFSNMVLDSNRVFDFATFPQDITLTTGINPYTLFDRINLSVDNNVIESFGCRFGSLQFVVYDTVSLMPWKDIVGSGKYGSYPVCARSGVNYRYFFEFPDSIPSYRKAAMDFIDSIPTGMYVSITYFGNAQFNADRSFISDWKNDTTTLGPGNDLYDKLKSIGFTDIDSFTSAKPFIYFYRKNTPSFTPIQEIGAVSDNLSLTVPISTKVTSGSVLSPLFGPATTWQSLHWRGTSVEPVSTDSVLVQVYGVRTDGTEVLVKTVSSVTDTSLASVSAVTYPYLQLKLTALDTVYATPEQLNYWRINGAYVPEGAIAPNILYTMQDTVSQGQNINFSIAFKNVSPVAFDSLTTLLTITDASNVTHTIPIPKSKALISGDTLSINYTINSLTYPGLNTLYLMVNPNNAQPEQYLYNNFIYQNFYVKADNTDPLLDVTFDGVHILNKDLVSAKPHILIKMTDESKFLALSDTSLFSVSIGYPGPNGTTIVVPYHFGADTMMFTPANLTSGQNVATIDLAPAGLTDGQYELIVSGKDAQGNPTGNLQYKIAFKVITKSSISELLNYPNPFTTSTAFVFTLTGSVIPQNMKIEIMTITGKVVREITSAELGPIHVGVNITQFKWDGTDMYGQKLGNGVYLYRVMTNLNGKSIDKYDISNIDQYFTAGYGKMYLMR